MARTIKFRGKNSKGEWVFGSVVYFCNSVAAIHFEIGTTAVRRFDWCYVDPDTVGQYTGLKDKNGKEIYEGDIIGGKARSGDKMILHVVFYEDSEGRFKAGLNGTKERYSFGCCGLEDAQWMQRKTIIGNIYDNPELLKK